MHETITCSKFLETIFAHREPGEEIVVCVQPQGGTPGLPLSMSDMEAVLKRMPRATKPVGMYFGTSTVHRGEEGVRNRRSQFEGAYCLVLDDVGTKVAVEALPELFQSPTWIIESSEGNFQYGFLYDEALRDYEIAKTVLDQVVHGVGADTGGCMPCKLVRLPAGANAKAGVAWNVRLTEWHPERDFTPDELLEAAGSTLRMAELRTAPTGAIQRDPRRVAGTAAYRTVNYHHGGVVDDVAEWLISEGMVLDDGGAFWRVRCPWAHEHTNPEDVAAYYSPLGCSGSTVPKTRRFFKCFHDSHTGKTTKDFLWWVQDQGGPVASEHDPAAERIAEWVLSPGSWHNIRTGMSVPSAAFREKNQEVIVLPRTTPTGRKSFYRTTVYDAMVKSPSLIKPDGRRYAPGEPAIVTDGPLSFVNECVMPVYPYLAAEYDSSLVQPALDFLTYLIPHTASREWFLDHLAMKARKPKYRGNAVFMHTPATGTGRGTLTKILRLLWGAANVRDSKYQELVDGMSGGFNAHLRGLWVCVAEMPTRVVHEHGWRSTVEFNELKNVCEPGHIDMTFNEKFGSKWVEPWYASVLLCSNDAAALAADRSDRRIMRIENTTSPRGNDYFESFHAWLEGSGWQPHFWAWLLERDLSGFKPGQNLSLEWSEEREIAAVEQEQVLDNAVGFALEYVRECGGVFDPGEVIDVLSALMHRLDLSELQRRAARSLVARSVRRQSRFIKVPSSGNYYQLRQGDVRIRPRVLGGMEQQLGFWFEADEIAAECHRCLDRFVAAEMTVHVMNRFAELRPEAVLR